MNTLVHIDVSEDLLRRQRIRGARGADPCEECSVRSKAFCSALGESEQRRLNEFRDGLSLRRGEPLVWEGEPVQHLFSVTTGILKAYKLLPDGRRQIVAFLYPGDIHGIIASETHTASVDAVTSAELCRFPRQLIEQQFPTLGRRMLRIARAQLTAAQEQLLLLGCKSAMERVASFFLDLAAQAEVDGTSDHFVHVPMSREDIGDYLGLSIETVSRAITALGRENTIAQDNERRIFFRNFQRLRAIANGYTSHNAAAIRPR